MIKEIHAIAREVALLSVCSMGLYTSITKPITLPEKMLLAGLAIFACLVAHTLREKIEIDRR